MTIDGGTVIATGADSTGEGAYIYSFGIFSYQNLNISGGDVTGIGGTGELSCGIGCNLALTIKGGTVVGKGGPLAGANIQYSAGINGMGEVEISGGTVTGTGGDTEAGDSFGICTGDTTSYNVVTVSIKDATVTATGGTAASGNSSGISATNTIAAVRLPSKTPPLQPPAALPVLAAMASARKLPTLTNPLTSPSTATLLSAPI